MTHASVQARHFSGGKGILRKEGPNATPKLIVNKKKVYTPDEQISSPRYTKFLIIRGKTPAVSTTDRSERLLVAKKKGTLDRSTTWTASPLTCKRKAQKMIGTQLCKLCGTR